MVETLCEYYKPVDMVASKDAYNFWTRTEGLSGDPFCCNCVSAMG